MTVSLAAVQTAIGRMEYRSIPVPDDIKPGFGLLRVEANGVCGSDVSHFMGSFGLASMNEYPVIRGHEAVGHVVALSPEAAKKWGVAVGDRIVVEPVAPCQRCHPCAEGNKNLCASRFVYGRRSLREGQGLWGAFSEYMLIHPDSRVHRIPDTIPIAEAALHNALAGGFEWTVKSSNMQLGDDVVIFGPGLRGIAGIIAARAAGARNIIVIGRGNEEKAELARLFGATHVLNSEADNVIDHVREISPGGAQRLIDFTPKADWPLNAAVAMAAPGATIVIVGVKGRDVAIASDQLMHKVLTVTGVSGPGDWGYDQAIDTIVSRRLPIDLLSTHRFGLTEAETAIRTLAAGSRNELALGVFVTA